MIYCTNYLDKGKGSNNKRLIFAELQTTTTPSSLNIVPSANISGLPEIVSYDNMDFAPGSTLLVTSTASVYSYLDGTFNKIG